MSSILLTEQLPETRPASSARTEVSVRVQTTEQGWSDYVEAHPAATVDHLWGWRSVFERVFGQECVYLTAQSAGRTSGVLPLVCFNSRLFGRVVVSVPYLNYGGILASDSDAAEALLDHARIVGDRFGASYVEVRNPKRWFPHLPFRQHKVRMALPLPSIADDLWKALDRKVRNQVRKAQKEALTTEAGGTDLVADFYAVFASNMRDLGTPVYSKRLFTAVFEQFPTRARIFVVRHQGQPVAAAVSIRFRDTVLVPWASSLRAYRQRCPNMLLYWTMIESAIADGVRVFDFGRSSPDAGTFQFKQQWGAVPEPQFWEYIQRPGQPIPDHGTSNGRFDIAIDVWKRLPLWLANTVGPHIVRHVP